MKILSFVSPLVALLLLVTPVALAQTTSPVPSSSPTRSTIKQELHSTRQASRDAFKQKLTEIKDQRKQALVEKIDATMQQINTHRTTQMSEALTRLSGILDRVEAKAGDDTASKTAIMTARNAITSAQQAVATQQAKDYVITITSEATLGQTVKTAIQKLRTDLQATHTTVLAAQKAVIQAAQLNMKEHKLTPTATGAAH